MRGFCVLFVLLYNVKMIRRIGGAEGAGFPGQRSRDHKPGKPAQKSEKTADTTPPKRRRSSPGKDWGGNLDIDV